MKNKKAFTLIELVSVLVILAILALIVTPLVLNIIRKARTAADKRSIDAYGRSIELAIADYLLDNGTFPTSIEELTIEYSGDRVECSTTQLNSDSSIYLAECTVNNREITGYTYGTDKSPSYTAYSVGDEVTYNNVDYYVIKDSGTKESSVILLKAEPLTYEEIQTYSSETDAVINTNGGIKYHSSSNDYYTSYVKQVVDMWKVVSAPAASEARLITVEEVSNIGYDETCVENGACEQTENTPSWLYNNDYSYWTMSVYNNSTSGVWRVFEDGRLNGGGVGSPNDFVRPVIVLSKSVL